MANVPTIGLDMFHVAPIVSDGVGGTVYGTPVHIPNITQANVNFNTSMGTFFADDGPAVSYSQLGEPEATINVANLTSAEYALLTGADLGGTGRVAVGGTISAPDLAVGFRSQRADGSYRYMWLFKGKFGVPNMSHQTKENTVNFQQQELMFRAVSRIGDRLVMSYVDSNDSALPAALTPSALMELWFQNPDYVPADPVNADLTALTENLAGAFVPAFAPDTYSYTLAALDTEDEVEITATRATGGITINGVDATSGVAQTIPLAVGANTVTIEAAETGFLPSTYTITVTRAE